MQFLLLIKVDQRPKEKCFHFQCQCQQTNMISYLHTHFWVPQEISPSQYVFNLLDLSSTGITHGTSATQSQMSGTSKAVAQEYNLCLCVAKGNDSCKTHLHKLQLLGLGKNEVGSCQGSGSQTCQTHAYWIFKVSRVAQTYHLLLSSRDPFASVSC